MAKRKRKRDYTPQVDAVLDLHGCTSEEARRETIAFLEDSMRKNYKRVRIIVGKGTHSEDGIAVLPSTIKAVLTEHALSYTYAKLHDGGEGALEVSL